MRNDIIVTTRAGIGDMLLCTPTLRAVKECHPQRRLIVYCVKRSHLEVLRHNPYVDSVRMLPPLYLWRYPYHLYCYLFNKHWKRGHLFNPEKLKFYSLRYNHIPVSWLYDKSIKEIVPEIFADLNVRLVEKNIQVFFTKKEEQNARKKLAPFKNVVIMHIFSRTSVNHHWPMDRWNELVRQLPEYTFIQVGQSDEPQVAGAIDWRSDKMGIREMFCLLKYATSFIGVDSCMAHATNAFNIPGVVLFGDTSPVHWGHDNNINIYKGVRCAPCFHFANGDPCPYTHDCMDRIAVEEVKQALRCQVESRIGVQAGALSISTWGGKQLTE
ncbi:glycosyltransferase family 9 protein [Paraflavitalea pollutisoli]|uniref:glycosyltransferase family 9 protein n=1 Tax=Paraflavitalea pollutisoli TaxID=3034143 RepID=UPI0023ED89F1|nr:glycosyltransferase family 9 protein [Paraflavitalea sp. H1-2-19X]